jgi:hypothetical protein
MKIAVIVPSGDLIHADTCGSLIQIVSHLSAAGHQAAFINPRSSAIQRGRHMGAKHALDLGVDALYWQDSDVVAPFDTVTRLLSWRKPVIGATYRRRRAPYTQTAENINGEPVDITGKTGIGKIPRLPGGCTLVAASVYQGLELPWYDMPWDNDRQTPTGEDEFFCDRCVAEGIQPWIDYGLSKEIGHIGTIKITHGVVV